MLVRYVNIGVAWDIIPTVKTQPVLAKRYRTELQCERIGLELKGASKISTMMKNVTILFT